MTAEEIQAVRQAAVTPAQRLAIGLAAVHAAHPKVIRELTLERAGPGLAGGSSARRWWVGSGHVGWMVQFVPFQRSASVSRWLPGGPLRTPTAVHAFAALHDTPARTGGLPPEGSAACWRAHAVPSPRSRTP